MSSLSVSPMIPAIGDMAGTHISSPSTPLINAPITLCLMAGPFKFSAAKLARNLPRHRAPHRQAPVSEDAASRTGALTEPSHAATCKYLGGWEGENCLAKSARDTGARAPKAVAPLVAFEYASWSCSAAGARGAASGPTSAFLAIFHASRTSSTSLSTRSLAVNTAISCFTLHAHGRVNSNAAPEPFSFFLMQRIFTE